MNALSWNLEGTRLLVGTSSIQLWQSPEESDIHPSSESAQVGFTLGNADMEDPEWECIWRCETASPIYHLRFSPDGLLFASASKVCLSVCTLIMYWRCIVVNRDY